MFMVEHNMATNQEIERKQIQEINGDVPRPWFIKDYTNHFSPNSKDEFKKIQLYVMCYPGGCYLQNLNCEKNVFEHSFARTSNWTFSKDTNGNQILWFSNVDDENFITALPILERRWGRGTLGAGGSVTRCGASLFSQNSEGIRFGFANCRQFTIGGSCCKTKQ